jgi:UDP-4-amino-4,6-dideoxy-N-acetyl-beta-L-altrosamine transaminase
MTRDKILPYGRQSIDDEDIEAVLAVLQSDYLTTGPAIEKFETQLAELVDAPYAVSCSSGTAALHLACLALNVSVTEAGIVPAITFVATANALRYCGAEVRFADVEPETGLSGAEEFQQAFQTTSEIPAKYLIPVHLNGQCADPEAIWNTAKSHGLRVIEDACHALGADYATSDGARHRVGACKHSDMAIFSFHPVKAIATGEGGAVTTRDPELYRRLLLYRNHGLERDKANFTASNIASPLANDADAAWYYELQGLGFNYRLSDIHAALGYSQLQKLSQFVKRRRELAKSYDTLLSAFAPLLRPVANSETASHGYHLYAVLIDFENLKLDKKTVVRKLADQGILTQVHYLPVPAQPYYLERYGAANCENAWHYYRAVLSLPLFVGMENTDVEYVVERLTATLGL